MEKSMNRPWKRSARRVPRDLSALFLGFLVLFAPTGYSRTKPDQSKSEAIRRALSEIVASAKAPGMIAAIISSQGVLAIGSAGVRKAGSAAAITSQDLVHLGSCTKAMTAVMIATLVAEGKLGWDTKLTDAIPELKKGLHPDYRGVTLWQLLTHRAGVANNAVDWGAHSEKEIKERRLALLKDNLARPAATPVGEFNYSNFGYMIAACMAEQITGSSWEALMKKRLFDPLGMTSAGYGEPDAGQTVAQPWGHSGSEGKWRPSRDYDEEALGPAGEIHCTVEDWGKFLALQLGGRNPILDRKHLNKLLEPVGFYAGGWGIIDGLDWAKGKAHTHNGSNGLWFATVLVAPGIDRAFVVVTNSRDFVGTRDLCAEMIRKLKELDARKADDEETSRPPVRDAAPEVRVTYVGNAGFLIAVGDKKILIDALFSGFPGGYTLPEEIRDKMALGRPPFDGIDLALATHSHGDHFESGLVRRFLVAQSRRRLRLHTPGRGFSGRLPRPGDRLPTGKKQARRRGHPGHPCRGHPSFPWRAAGGPGGNHQLRLSRVRRRGHALP